MFNPETLYANLSFQNVKLTEAKAFLELESVPFFIKFEGENGGWGEVCFHIGNIRLAEELVRSINDVLVAHDPKLTVADDIAPVSVPF